MRNIRNLPKLGQSYHTTAASSFSLEHQKNVTFEISLRNIRNNGNSANDDETTAASTVALDQTARPRNSWNSNANIINHTTDITSLDQILDRSDQKSMIFMLFICFQNK